MISRSSKRLAAVRMIYGPWSSIVPSARSDCAAGASPAPDCIGRVALILAAARTRDVAVIVPSAH